MCRSAVSRDILLATYISNLRDSRDPNKVLGQGAQFEIQKLKSILFLFSIGYQHVDPCLDMYGVACVKHTKTIYYASVPTAIRHATYCLF